MALLSFDDLSPWEGLTRLQRELEQLVGRPGIDLGVSGSSVFPPVNVFTDGNGLVVRAEVPGIPSGSIDVTVEPRRLSISGERPHTDGGAGAYHRRERPVGKFSRVLQLPDDLDPAAATARCADGLLTIQIPRRAEAKPRTVTIQPA